MPLRHLLAACCAAAALIFAALPSPATDPPLPATQNPEVEPPAVDFALKNPRGRTRRLADFRGKVVIVTFGYTQCPDVCPMTLTLLAQVMRELGEDAKRVQVLFITVDPERDSAQLLARYVPAFNPAFLGLRGSAEETARAAERFDVDYRKQPGTTPGSYSVDHTAASFIIDPKGRLRVVVAYGQGPDVFVRDIRRLLAAFPAS